MITCELFVGADNATGVVDTELLGKILDSSHDGWTMVNATGSWRGQREPSVIVTIHDHETTIRATAVQIRDELNQDAVGFRIVPTLSFI